MQKIRVAVVGLGNIGHHAIEAILCSPDMELAGIIRRDATLPDSLNKHTVVNHISKLENVDVALLCIPSLLVAEQAQEILKLGIHTVDCFDIHSKIPDLHETLSIVAKEHKSVAIIASGWDPGSDSVIRALLEAMAPKGITYTDFGPGMSMGHTVAVKAIEGVSDALSMTIPVGTGLHRRMVYISLKPGADFSDISDKIKKDPYFCNDETIVTEVARIDDYMDTGHGVCMSRKGVCGQTHNQRFEFKMSVNNPALTSQIMVACARAAKRASVKMGPGAYTMIELPVVDLLPGETSEWIKKLV